MTNSLIRSHLTGPDGLATELARQRALAGMTVRELAAAASMDKSKVSRLLSGRTLPTVDDVATIGAALDLDPIVIEGLIQDAAAVAATAATWRARFTAGRGSTQPAYHVLDTDSTDFISIQSAVVPGVLQIERYARWILDRFGWLHDIEVDVDASVRSRLARARHLNNPNKTFQFLIAEHVLRFVGPGVDVAVEQLDHLADVVRAERPNVSVGLIPNDVDVPPFDGTVDIYDRQLVVVEGIATERLFRGPEAKAFLLLADNLLSIALTDDKALDLLSSVRQSLLQRR